MKKNRRTILAFILSLAMVFSLVTLPTAQVKANEEDGRSDVMYIIFTDLTENPEKVEIEHYMYKAPDYGSSETQVVPSYKGITFNEKTSTLVLKNAVAPTVRIFADADVLNVSVEGNCKLAQIVIHGTSKISFSGSGTLEINAPYTGLIYDTESDGEMAVTLSSKHIFPYALELRGGAIESYIPFISVGDQLTLKLNGYKAKYDYDGFDKAYSAKVWFPDKVANDQSKFVQHSGIRTPEVVWESKLEETDNHENLPSDYHILKASGSNFVVKKTVSANDVFDNIYYHNTALSADSRDYYQVTKNDDGKLIISNTTNTSITSSVVRAVSDDELNAFSGTTDTETISVYSKIDKPSQGYGYHYKKDGADYYLSPAGWLYGNSQGKLYGIENAGSAYAEGYYLTKTFINEGMQYQECVTHFSEDDYKKVKENLIKQGYIYAGTTDYNSYFWLTNTSQVFSPKSSSGGSGGAVANPGAAVADPGGAVADPGVTEPKTGTGDQKTETPKSGDTVETDNGDFKLTEDKSGNMTAEYSANEKTMMQKNVTIPDVVEVNGEKVPVTAIADNAFSGNKTLTTLKFKGKNLQKVGKNAFSKCPNLKSAVLPDSVTEISKGAFDGDKKLAKITLNGNNLKKVGKNALRGIKKNATITIKAKNQSKYKKAVNMIKKAGNKKLKFKFKKAKK